MGQVYWARDTKLNRDVALKVLPEAFAADGDRIARFRREAQVLASLNHPHIAAIYGFEDSGSTHALVLELVEGPTLADRIAQGPIPMDEALAIAKQIAEAVEAAHEQGIIHRDLKPANIKVKDDGTVKVLDFGLAKAMEVPGSTVSATTSPTISFHATQAGIILGTAAYMAPEQARGKAVDRRVDNWAFGCVLYEMLAGKRAFEGDDISDILAAVLRSEPDWNAVPFGVRRLVKWCLEKDPKKRLQAIGDARPQLEFVADAESVPSTVSNSPRLLWMLAAPALAIVVVGLGFVHFTEPRPAPPHAYRLLLNPPDDGQFVFTVTTQGGFALSPDGTTVAFIARVNWKVALWVQPLSGTARMLSGTDNASFPFWSPDGRFIAFFAGGNLLRMAVAGGNPFVLCEVKSPRGGTWSNDGRIVFGTFPQTGLFQVPESGGVATPLTIPVAGTNRNNHMWPQAVTGGRVLFWKNAPELEVRGTYIASLGTPESAAKVVSSDSSALFSIGDDGKSYLLWLRGSTLVAQPFDPGSGRVTGASQAVASSVGDSGNTAFMHATAANGVLVYHPSPLSRLMWVDRNGKSSEAIGEPADIGMFRLSPDGRRAAVSRIATGGSDLWLMDLDRGVSTAYSTGRGSHSYPVWSPDGNTIIFSGTTGLTRRRLQGNQEDNNVVPPSGLQIPDDWSADGRALLYTSGRQVSVIQMGVDGKPVPGAKPETYAENLSAVRFAPGPNPRWVVYSSNESGRSEVYLQSFPTLRNAIRVSTDGGRWPAWGADGRELIYVSLDFKLMTVTVTPGDVPVLSLPRELFALSSTDNGLAPYDVSPDGQRFLVRAPAEQSDRALTVLINWTRLLEAPTTP
jgi:Tol biopolymer transport system component